jgi:sterol desaturase/sphingolipid hydroxylase (fatty acid hydroxylase superfamily)
MDFLMKNGEAFYVIAFFGSIAIISIWESLGARLALRAPLRTRWVGNFTLYFIGVAVTRMVLPGFSIAAAIWAEANHWGLFNLVDLPNWTVLLAVVLALDVSRYALHWLLHKNALLWRVHSMHHTDQDYDFTTAFRFHPLEALVFFAMTIGCVVLLGAPVTSVLFAEALFAFSAVAVHGNIRIPLNIDAGLRRIFVTPDLHRTHHSIDPLESASNYGSLLSCWDRLFGTYTPQPAKGHDAMGIGLKGYEDIANLKPLRMLIHPFLPPLTQANIVEEEKTP